MKCGSNYLALAILPAIVCALVSACGGDGSMDGNPNGPIVVNPGDTLVFESRQSVQCGSRGLTPQQSAMKLTQGGVDVMESACGAMTGVAFPAVCGAATGDLILHEIRTVNLTDARQLGFESVAVLQGPADGTGFAQVDCQTGMAVK